MGVLGKEGTLNRDALDRVTDYSIHPESNCAVRLMVVPEIALEKNVPLNPGKHGFSAVVFILTK